MGRRRGYVLIALSLSIFFLLGMVGLAVDVGRMYVVKNESQSFCDSAAMFAASKLLDSTIPLAEDRIKAAAAAVTWVAQDSTGPRKRFEFSTREFQNVTTTFAKAWNAPPTDWVNTSTAATAADAGDYVFVKVHTTNPINLWFLPVLVSSTSSNIAAAAVAGVSAESQMVQGIAPFAPLQLPAPDSGVCTASELVGCSYSQTVPPDPYGMVAGQWYTLRWVAGTLQPSDIQYFCPADRCECMRKLANQSAAAAGYAMYDGASDIWDAIVGTPPVGTPLTVGSTLNLENGQINREMEALSIRVDPQDSDPTSTQYIPAYPPYPSFPHVTAPPKTDAPYSGNGRRILVTPVQSAAGANDGNTKQNTVVGFAGFFLGPSGVYPQGHASTIPACGQYLGEYTFGLPGSGGTGPGGHTVYTLRLYR